MLSLWYICPGVGKNNIKRNNINAFSLWLIWSRPSTGTPSPGIMKFTIFVGPSLTILTVNLRPRVENKIFKEIHQFYTFYDWIGFYTISPIFQPYDEDTPFTPKLYPLVVGGGSRNLHLISCRLTIQILHTKFGKDWPWSSWEEDDNGRRTTDANRSPEWPRWPKTSVNPV